MLTLFTGGPGAGKTAQMVAELDKLLATESNRPIYVDGVNGLTLPHTPLDARTWSEQLPDGALLLVDEVQRVWRPRGPGARVPAEIEALETHRHRGIDIWMTTQAPRLVDANVRSLVGRHIHLRDTGWLGRWWYEWPECNEGLNWKNCPVKFKHKLPKGIFDKYKSASLHITPKRRAPLLAYIAIALVVLVVFLGFMIARSIKARQAGPEKPPAAAPGAPGGSQTPAIFTSNSRPGAQPAYITDASQFMPRISSRPETAPAFDDLVRVRQVPRVVAGFCRGQQQVDCSCFTQQGTNSGLSSSECLAWIKSPPFDPFRDLAPPAAAPGAQAASAPPAAPAPSPL